MNIKTIKLSKDEDYYNQRNNVIDPMVSCQVTAYINALITNGYKESDLLPENSKYKQPEDYFNSLFELPDVQEYANSIAPAFDGHIREIHDVIVYTCNKHLLKNEVASFSTERTIQECFDMIVKHNKAFVVSGVFCGFGHVVSVSGVKYDDYTGKIISWFIDDPYGDYHSDYSIPKGNDIEMPMVDFMSIIKNRNIETKWAHFFK